MNRSQGPEGAIQDCFPPPLRTSLRYHLIFLPSLIGRLVNLHSACRLEGGGWPFSVSIHELVWKGCTPIFIFHLYATAFRSAALLALCRQGAW